MRSRLQVSRQPLKVLRNRVQRYFQRPQLKWKLLMGRRDGRKRDGATRRAAAAACTGGSEWRCDQA